MATFEKKTMKQYLVEKEIEANSKVSGAERKLRNKGWAKQVEKDKKKKAATSSALVSFLAWRELSPARVRWFILPLTPPTPSARTPACHRTAPGQPRSRPERLASSSATRQQRQRAWQPPHQRQHQLRAARAAGRDRAHRAPAAGPGRGLRQHRRAGARARPGRPLYAPRLHRARPGDAHSGAVSAEPAQLRLAAAGGGEGWARQASAGCLGAEAAVPDVGVPRGPGT